MDKSSLDRFRKILNERSEELRTRLGADRHGGTALSEAKDEGDRAAASTTAEMSAVQRTQAEALQRMVSAALRRIHDGTYGDCLHCGREIGSKRLEAIPWARYCITCQELIDER